MNRILDTQWGINRLVLDNQLSMSDAYILSALRMGSVDTESRVAPVTNESRITTISNEARIVNA